MRGMMMKAFLALLASMIVGTTALAQVADPQSTSEISAVISRVGDDPVVPWPWGFEAPFPWTFVQGVWLAEYKDFRSYYTFRVVKQKTGLNQLEVRQIDPTSCEALAVGVGYEQDRVVRAQMSAKGTAYRIALRSFNENVVSSHSIVTRPVNGQYMVLTVIPFDSAQTVAIPIQLMTNRLTFRCLVQE